MKRLETLLKLSLCCLMLSLFAGCNNEDDINGIFIERTWYVTNLFEADGKTPALDEEQHKEILNNPGNYRIAFTPETFNAQAGDCVFSGQWSVDGKNQSIRFTMDTGTSGTDPISIMLIKVLEDAVRYEGSYTFLRIYTKEGTSVLFDSDE